MKNLRILSFIIFLASATQPAYLQANQALTQKCKAKLSQLYQKAKLFVASEKFQSVLFVGKFVLPALCATGGAYILYRSISGNGNRPNDNQNNHQPNRPNEPNINQPAQNNDHPQNNAADAPYQNIQPVINNPDLVIPPAPPAPPAPPIAPALPVVRQPLPNNAQPNQSRPEQPRENRTPIELDDIVAKKAMLRQPPQANNLPQPIDPNNTHAHLMAEIKSPKQLKSVSIPRKQRPLPPKTEEEKLLDQLHKAIASRRGSLGEEEQDNNEDNGVWK